MPPNYKSIVFLLGLFFGLSVQAQDTIVLLNEDRVIGDFKGMSRGVATIETDYSDADFTIEWSGVRYVVTNKVFLIKYEGSDYDAGKIRMNPSDPSQIMMTYEEGAGEVTVPLQSIVELSDLDGGWIDRMSANISVGASLTRANNLRQFTASGLVGYIDEDFSINATVNSIYSTQDDANDTRRTDASLTGQVFITRGWFGAAAVNYLSDEEINLTYRLNNRAGLGKNWYQTNTWYFSSTVGVANNQEEFSGEDASIDNSWEAFVTLELNLFDTGDLSLFSNFTAFPSLTEAGRFRYDAKLDVKYDLPYDFFVKLGTTLNFDNQPSGGAVPLSYIFQTTFGWEL